MLIDGDELGPDGETDALGERLVLVLALIEIDEDAVAEAEADDEGSVLTDGDGSTPPSSQSRTTRVKNG